MGLQHIATTKENVMSIVKKLLVMVGMVVISATTITSHAATTASATTYVKDSAITADVKAKLLADTDVKSLHISVRTMHHKVILTGHVETTDQKEKAGSIASSADGVTSVENKLMVKAVK
jgi:hyperosmotically inducible protein